MCDLVGAEARRTDGAYVLFRRRRLSGPVVEHGGRARGVWRCVADLGVWHGRGGASRRARRAALTRRGPSVATPARRLERTRSPGTAPRRVETLPPHARRARRKEQTGGGARGAYCFSRGRSTSGARQRACCQVRPLLKDGLRASRSRRSASRKNAGARDACVTAGRISLSAAASCCWSLAASRSFWRARAAVKPIFWFLLFLRRLCLLTGLREAFGASQAQMGWMRYYGVWCSDPRLWWYYGRGSVSSGRVLRGGDTSIEPFSQERWVGESAGRVRAACRRAGVVGRVGQPRRREAPGLRGRAQSAGRRRGRARSRHGRRRRRGDETPPPQFECQRSQQIIGWSIRAALAADASIAIACSALHRHARPAAPRRAAASPPVNLLQLSTSDLQPARTWDAAEADGVCGVRRRAVAAVAAFGRIRRCLGRLRRDLAQKLFKGRKVVLFALPGAFTGCARRATCRPSQN